jgi:hypothetical protein
MGEWWIIQWVDEEPELVSRADLLAARDRDRAHEILELGQGDAIDFLDEAGKVELTATRITLAQATQFQDAQDADEDFDDLEGF